jgi:hypothetical protein
MDDETPLRPPIRPAPVTVFLLALDPPDAPEELLPPWLRLVETLPLGSQLIVLDDRGTWNRDLLGPLAAERRLRLIHHARPLDVGGCLQTALLVADTPLVLLAPCDRQFDADLVLPLFEQIDKVDLVLACRDVGSPPLLWRLGRWLSGMAARILLGYVPEPRPGWPGSAGGGRRWLIRRLFGVPLFDPQSNLWLARRELLHGLPVQSRGPFAWVELLAKVNHLGALLTEVAIPWHPPAPTAPPRFFNDLWLVFRRPDFGPPRVRADVGQAANAPETSVS